MASVEGIQLLAGRTRRILLPLSVPALQVGMAYIVVLFVETPSGWVDTLDHMVDSVAVVIDKAEMIACCMRN